MHIKILFNTFYQWKTVKRMCGFIPNIYYLLYENLISLQMNLIICIIIFYEILIVVVK